MVAGLLCVFAHFAFGAQENARRLNPGESTEREMAGGEVHTYQLSAAQGQYVRVRVEQRGIDVVVRMYGPGPERQRLAEVDSPNGMYGPEFVSVITPASGDYNLEVRSNDRLAPAGRYEITVEGPREPQQADTERVAAAQAFAEAQRLRSQATAESRQAAVDKYKEAANLWNTLGSPQEEAYALCNVGRTYKALGKAEEALSYLGRAAAILRDVQDRRGQAFMLNEAGAVYRDLGNPLQALDSYNQAAELRRDAGDRWGQAQILNNIGFIYARTGDQHKALEFYYQALNIWQAVSDRNKEAITLNNIAGALDSLGEPLQALEKYEQVLGLSQKYGYSALEADARNNIGKIDDTRGDSQEALEQYEAALALYRQTKNAGAEALALDNMGMVYAGWGDPQRALESFGQALDIQKGSHEPSTEATTLKNIGYAYSLQGDQKKALSNYEQALPLYQKARNREGLADTLGNIGLAYASSGEPQKALEKYQEALGLYKEMDDPRGQARILDKIGQAYASTGQAKQALEKYNQSIPLWQAVGDKQGEAITLYDIARVEDELGDIEEARRKIESAIEIVESLRTKITSQQLRTKYLTSKQNYYELDIDVRMRLHLQPADKNDEAALYASERARARGLLDILNESRADVRRGGDPELIARKEKLERDLNALAESLIRLRGLKQNERAAAVEKELNAVIAEYDDVQAKIRAKSRAYAALTQPRIMGLKEIQQQLLDADTLLLEYALGEPRSYLWAVTKDGMSSYQLPGRAEIERAARPVMDSLVSRQAISGEKPEQYQARVLKADSQYWPSAAALSDLLLRPVAAQLGNKRLLVVPDGILRFIPLGALPAPGASSPNNLRARTPAEGRGANPTPMIAAHEIIYEPSASTLGVLRAAPHKPAPKTVAVLADPVFDNSDDRLKVPGGQKATATATQPGSNELKQTLRDIGADESGFERLRHSLTEADEIMAAASTGSGMKAVGFQASRATAMSPELGRYRIVHFATHSVINDKHPELSGIVLSLIDETGAPQDGFLRLHDIYNLNLPADLVVLSACQTGLGTEVKGEGLIGLTRGFMYAGAERVVASLWKVNDEATAELMKHFYRHMLKEKMSPAMALKAAQLDTQKEGLWRAPYYWAAFVIQGEWD